MNNANHQQDTPPFSHLKEHDFRLYLRRFFGSPLVSYVESESAAGLIRFGYRIEVSNKSVWLAVQTIVRRHCKRMCHSHWVPALGVKLNSLSGVELSGAVTISNCLRITRRAQFLGCHFRIIKGDGSWCGISSYSLLF